MKCAVIINWDADTKEEAEAFIATINLPEPSHVQAMIGSDVVQQTTYQPLTEIPENMATASDDPQTAPQG
jgi:hypothetical protein